MAIQLQGNSGVLVEVDGTTFRAMRVTARPLNYGVLGHYCAGAISGTMAAALAANSEIYQWRWPDATNLAIVYWVRLSAGTITAATAAGAVGFRLCVARSWTVAGSGGTRLVLSGNNCKLRTSMGSSLVNDIGISTTAALTAGTKTLDTTDLANYAATVLTGAITTQINGSVLVPTLLFDSSDGVTHPLVFSQNEGFVVRSGAANWPAAATWSFGCTTAWAEAAAF